MRVVLALRRQEKDRSPYFSPGEVGRPAAIPIAAGHFPKPSTGANTSKLGSPLRAEVEHGRQAASLVVSDDEASWDGHRAVAPPPSPPRRAIGSPRRCAPSPTTTNDVDAQGLQVPLLSTSVPANLPINGHTSLTRDLQLECGLHRMRTPIRQSRQPLPCRKSDSLDSFCSRGATRVAAAPLIDSTVKKPGLAAIWSPPCGDVPLLNHGPRRRSYR